MASVAESTRKTMSGTRPPGGEPRALLKMNELAERSGVSPGTIRYYLREGLLGEGEDVLRTSRNMAYYPPEYVERIVLIKRLQEERVMPLRVIRDALAQDPERVLALIELEDRILERAVASAEDHSRVSRKLVQERYGVPRIVLQRLAELGVLTPNQRGYDKDDVKIIEAIASFRAATTRRSASPCTTPCATARRSSRWWRRRCARCSTAWPARSRSSAPWR
jgi:DNA-binding transcriptional MerR regulator